jgi:hypothetical protein
VAAAALLARSLREEVIHVSFDVVSSFSSVPLYRMANAPLHSLFASFGIVC